MCPCASTSGRTWIRSALPKIYFSAEPSLTCHMLDEQGENARLPLGAPAKLQVRYADSLEEKKAKRATASARSFLQPEARLHEHLPAGFMSFPSPGEVTSWPCTIPPLRGSWIRRETCSM